MKALIMKLKKNRGYIGIEAMIVMGLIIGCGFAAFKLVVFTDMGNLTIDANEVLNGIITT